MTTDRREFFRTLTAGAAAAAIPSLSDFSPAGLLPRVRASEPGGPIILSRNENAYGPSQKVISSMQESLQFANRYPDLAVSELHKHIADSHSVKPEQLVLGCGSGEILNIAAAAFLGPGKKLITAVPTFEAIGKSARVLGAEVIEIPLMADYSHDLATILSRADSATGLVYICNPNNPTGSLTPRRDLESFIRKLPSSTTVFIDEAYHHFAVGFPDYSSFLGTKFDDPRVIVARTFSKIFGLAGMRVGYAVGTTEKIQALSARRLAEGLNAVGARAALVAYQDSAHVEMGTRRNSTDREEFFQQAQSRKVQVIPSFTNFAMLNARRSATEVIEHFRKNNILIARLFPSMNSFVRVSFGTPSEMKEFWRVWDLMAA